MGTILSLEASWGPWTRAGAVFRSTWVLWQECSLLINRQDHLLFCYYFSNRPDFDFWWNPISLLLDWDLELFREPVCPPWKTSGSSNDIYWPASCTGPTTGNLDSKHSEHRLFLTLCSGQQLEISSNQDSVEVIIVGYFLSGKCVHSGSCHKPS